jgi:ABC-type Zn uptake system ZnuABC Zn-binding protein ZnuA
MGAGSGRQGSGNVGSARARLVASSVALVLWAVLAVSGCGTAGDSGGAGTISGAGDGGQPAILADTSFLADIAQNVAGDKLTVTSLIPIGADPHAFEPTPQDAKRVAESRVVIINVSGLEPQVDRLITGAGGPHLLVIEAAAGLAGGSEDPHFWLDPIAVITYAENIAKGLAAIDPAGAGFYGTNAEKYAESLRELDAWITAQVQTIPTERRLLVTNHESFGRFARRYGFRIVGAIFPTTSGEGSPSAMQLATLVDDIRASGAPAIFLETGSCTDLARQVAEETGVRLVTDLYTHSLGENVSTYVDMMRWNVNLIVEALR